MSEKGWQAPIMFELDDLADEPKASPVYQKPVVLPAQAVQPDGVIEPQPIEIKTESVENTPLITANEAVVEESASTETVFAEPQPYARPYTQVQWTSTHLSAHIDPNITLPPLQQQVKEFLTAPKSLPKWLINSIVPQENPHSLLYSPWLWLFGGLFSLYALLLLADTAQLLQQQFQHSVLLGILFSAMVTGILTAIAYLLGRAYHDIQHLHTVEQLQQEGEKLQQHDGFDGQGLAYVNKINRIYLSRADLKPAIERFYLVVDNCHTNGEVCTLYSQRVLQPLDEQAQAIVAQRAGETAIMVVFSPLPLLSTLLTLWRNVKMIRDIAYLYGNRPSLLASLRLSALVIQNLIYAGVSEVIAHSIARLFDKSLSSILLGQMSQGIGSAIITARLGLKTMAVCRPMPFQAQEQPNIKTIAHEVADLLRSFVQKA